ncbi:hypothetical protein BJ912DRAFT_138312 [Pholiota molesta]|nr:hypothetical protein BJ912DRAFT_138312 [Pholiota molesta]
MYILLHCSPKCHSPVLLQGQSRNQIKFIQKPSKRDDKIRDPVATGTTLRRSEQQGIPVKRVCIEHSEIPGNSLWAFFSPSVPLFIRDGDKELFNLSSWPKNFLDMEYTTGENPTIQIKCYADDSSPRILTIRFHVKNDAKGRYDKLFTRLKNAIPKTGIVRDDKHLWELAERHSAQTAAEHHSSAKGKEPQFKKQKISASDAQPIHQFTSSDRYRSRASGVRGEGSEGQASRSTSKSRSNPPPPPQAKGIIAPRRSTRNAPPQKPVDQDKVILVYPQGIPGAVNITNGDLARLQPGEYLNDTLIEFGLKLWLKNLEEKQPELAQQVHIFNSFFYKKLNNKKNEVQAFETVRKWTSKFDIFQKKYIIVPINEHMHWYLAIIYEPEHILSSTAPDETPTRKRTRLSAKVDPEETISISAPEQADVVSSAKSITSSELAVERDLNTDFQSSCNIDGVVDDDMGAEMTETKKEDDASSDALSYVTDDDSVSHPQPPEAQTSLDNLKEAHLDSMDVDEVIEVMPGNQDDNSEVPTASTSKSVLEGSTLQRSISPSRFYGKSAKSKGKQKAKAKADPVDIDVEVQNKTYVFTFDSLGTNHPHAAKKLSQYLRMEAKDKKGIPNAGVATGRTAYVPVQPNFCDCGVYLIHFAQTFLTDPKKYFDIIMSQSKLTSNQEKQEQWNDKQVADLREELSTRILDLSTVWAKERALKEEEERAQQGSKDPDHINVDNSDDDIEMPSPVKISKSVRAAARMRG